VIPLQARCGPEGGQRYSYTLPWPRHYKGLSGQQNAPAALYHRERPGAYFTGGWVGPRPGLDGRKISSPLGFDPRTVQPVTSRYTDWASACNTVTTPTQPHRNSNTHQTKNNTTNVVIQQNSRKLLTMDILMFETCWAHKKWNKIASDIKFFFYSSTITMMHGPIYIKSNPLFEHSISILSVCSNKFSLAWRRVWWGDLNIKPLLQHTPNTEILCFNKEFDVEISSNTPPR